MFINKIIFLYSKFLEWKIILSLPKYPFNNNIAILESKIIYFCLRSNFRGSTTLKIEHQVYNFHPSKQKCIIVIN